MFVAEIDANVLLTLGVSLITTGTLASGVVFGIKGYKKVKKVFQERTGLVDTVKGLIEVGGELLNEGSDLAKQVMALSKAAQDSDKAVDRVNKNADLRQTIIEAASNAKFSDEDREALAQVLTPIKSGIRHYAGLETDKLAKLKDAMEHDLSAQETRNKIMTNSGQMAALIAKTALAVGPKILSGGKIDLSGLLEDKEEK